MRVLSSRITPSLIPLLSSFPSLFFFIFFSFPLVFIFLPLFLRFSSFPFLSISVSRSFVPLSLFRASRASSRTRIFFDISLALFLLFSLSLSLLSFFYNFFAFFPFSLVFVPLSFFIFRHACFAKRIFSFCVFYLFLSLIFFKIFFLLILFPVSFSSCFSLSSFLFLSRLFTPSQFFIFSLSSFFALRLSFLYFISSFIFLREFHSNRVDTSHVYNPYLVMFAREKNHGKSSSCSASPRFVLFFFFLVHSSVILYLFETFDRDIL